MKKTLLVVLAVFFVFIQIHKGKDKGKETSVNNEVFIETLVKQENPTRNPNLVGDKHMRNKAFGLLQIRATCVADVNKFVGKKKMKQIWGKSKLTAKDMRDFKKAKWVCLKYVYHWAKKKNVRPNPEILARIHNGGPDGYKDKDTKQYGKSYSKKYLAELKASQKKFRSKKA